MDAQCFWAYHTCPRGWCPAKVAVIRIAASASINSSLCFLAQQGRMSHLDWKTIWRHGAWNSGPRCDLACGLSHLHPRVRRLRQNYQVRGPLEAFPLMHVRSGLRETYLSASPRLLSRWTSTLAPSAPNYRRSTWRIGVATGGQELETDLRLKAWFQWPAGWLFWRTKLDGLPAGSVRNYVKMPGPVWHAWSPANRQARSCDAVPMRSMLVVCSSIVGELTWRTFHTHCVHRLNGSRIPSRLQESNETQSWDLSRVTSVSSRSSPNPQAVWTRSPVHIHIRCHRRFKVLWL